MLFQPRPITPIIIRVVPPPTEDVSVISILVDALGLVGLITIGALVTGLVFGVVLIWFKRWRERVAPDSLDTRTRLDLSTHPERPRDTGTPAE
jgi:hypothetical protein